MEEMRSGDVARAELRILFDHLQDTLCGGREMALALVDCLGYLRGNAAIATAAVSAGCVEDGSVEDFMPAGEPAKAYLQLISEIQMSLHEHPVNLSRSVVGQRPINALWLWGGGLAPDVTPRALPSLYCADPLTRGYWYSCGASASEWPGSFDDCVRSSAQGFVAVMPDASDALRHAGLGAWLSELQRLLKQGALQRVTLAFRDGHVAELHYSDRFRFWRRNAARLCDDGT
jgi:hypothetical protein